MARFEDFDKSENIRTPVRYEYKAEVSSEDDVRPYKSLNPANMNLNILQDNLGNCLSIIDDEVMKGYVTRLDQLPIIRPDEGFEKELNDIHFFKVSELVYQEEEFSVDKLGMVFHAMSNKPCTLVMMLKSNGQQTDFYLGARPKGDNSAGTLSKLLKQSLAGFFPGSRLDSYYDEDMKKDMQAVETGCISSVTCVADYKQNSDMLTNKDFIQGLEKFVYAMQGKSYTAVLIADNIDHQNLMRRKREYEQIYTQIAPFANMQMNFTVSDGKSSSAGKSEGRTLSSSHTETEGTSETETDTKTHTVGSSETRGTTDTDTETDTHTVNESEADGKSHTTGTSDGTSKTTSKGGNIGFDIPILEDSSLSIGAHYTVSNGTTHTESVSDSISKTLTHGFSDSKGHSHGHSNSRNLGISQNESTGRSVGRGTSQSVSGTRGEAFNLVNTDTLTESFGSSRGVTLNARNMTLNLVLQRLEKHLERIEECESFGMWNFAAYFLGETAFETETAANIYKSVIAGQDSGIERSAINTWEDRASVSLLASYVKNFVHPLFVYHGFSYDEDRYVAVDPSVLVSTNELAIHMGLPRHSVKGLPVVEHAAFAQEVITRNMSGGRTIRMGSIDHLGQKTETSVELDLDSLSMHTFITGSTGAGKSNAIYHLITEARWKEVRFLIVEPAKGEYKDVFADVRCYGTNPVMKDTQMLRINPFRFPEHTHILEHLDRLIEIFNVCWPMYAAMPAILKDSVERAYVKCGWDLEKSVNHYDPELFPTFADVVKQIREVLEESDYSSDNKGDYTGSLVTRLRSLTNGINGLIFTADDIRDEELFDQNVIVDLSRVGSSETKSLIMGLLVLKLQEHRMEQRSKGTIANDKLKHLTVLEEAHNLLRRTSTEQSGEGANLLGKSVEMLANSIAEMRTYGEGFVIADQSPGLLDMSVVRNTNTKIILRLPDYSDRELIGKAAGLTDKQVVELARLEKGVAAISQNDWLEPVLCRIDKYEENYFFSEKEPEYEEIDHAAIAESLLECIMTSEIERIGDRSEIRKLKPAVLRSKLDTDVKKDFMDYISVEKESVVKALGTLTYDFLGAEDAVNASRANEDIRSWVHSTVEHLLMGVQEYSREQIDKLIALLIQVQAEKDPEYLNILYKFVELHEEEGGVF